MTPPPELTPDQIGILVTDLEASMPRYGAMFGIVEWRVWTYGPDFIPQMSYRGRSGEFVMRLALSNTTQPQLELIQPMRGPSIYHDWLEMNKPGMHHIGTVVPSLEDAIESMSGAGYDLIQAGRGYGLTGDGGFAYFDTTADLGVVTEVIEIPAQRRPPEHTWKGD